jgi:hypothetical protein
MGLSAQHFKNPLQLNITLDFASKRIKRQPRVSTMCTSMLFPGCDAVAM